MLSTDLEDDPSFLALPDHLKRRIDSAFVSTASGTQSHSGWQASAGGFIVEESEPGPSCSAECAPGGFIVDDIPSRALDALSYIPSSRIPHALSFLDLSPDDDIMSVFENAAAGWGAQSSRKDGVSRKDWRAVCAALLEGEHVDDGEHPFGDEDANSGPESDEYQMEQLSSGTEEASSDEYEESSQTPNRAKKAQKVIPSLKRLATKSSGKEAKQLTESEKSKCRQDFGRFFPNVPDNELERQRIMIKDVARVADLLKENLKAEEILEMLGAFSSSPDKSMNLIDFERMMITTKLV